MTTVRDTSLSLAGRKPMLMTAGLDCENVSSPASCDSMVREVPKGNARNRYSFLLCEERLDTTLFLGLPFLQKVKSAQR